MDPKRVLPRIIIAGICIGMTLLGTLYISHQLASANDITITDKLPRLDRGTPDYPISGNVLWLRLDEQAGATTFFDTSGFDNDVTCSGDTCPQSGAPGVHGYGLTFDGVDDFAQGSSNGFPTGNDDRTMAAWVWMDNVVAQNAFFVGYGGFDNFSQIYLLYASNRRVCFSQSGQSVCGLDLELGRWYHLAVTNVENYVIIYVDGIKQNHGYLDIDTTPDSVLYLGSKPGTYGDMHRLSGALDEVLVFNRALSPEEILAIYQAGAGPVFAVKEVDKQLVHRGDPVNYTITATNTKMDDLSNVLITDTLPINLTYVEGSLSATSGVAGYQDGSIQWTGTITNSTTVTVSFGATVSSTVPVGSSITNEALIQVENEVYSRLATVDVIPLRLFMPCVYKPCLPVYVDDFSDPASGWGIGENDAIKVGYTNGEYQILIKEDGYFVGMYNNFGMRDYRIAVDARPRNHPDGTMGLIFAISIYGFYTFEINDGWFSVWRNDSSSWKWTPIIDWTYSPAINPGMQVNHLEVEHKDGDITVSANGEVLGTVNDTTYKGNGLGMLSEAFSANFDARFDNFTIYPATCGELPFGEAPTGFGITIFTDKVIEGQGKLHR